MSFLALPALLLLAAVPLLLWLALQRREPKQLEVGTLLLWRRVALAAQSATRSRRRLELLFWSALAAAVLGALGASRPAVQAAAGDVRVAVFIERLGAGVHEPELAEALERASAVVPDAALELYCASTTRITGMPDDTVMLAPGTIETELAQFETRTRHADARVLLLCQPHAGAERLGRVLPRALAQRAGVLFQVTLQGETVQARATRGADPVVEGLNLESRTEAGADLLFRYMPSAELATIEDRHNSRVSLARRPFVVGVGAAWATAQHRALYAALRADAAAGQAPDLWLGADDQSRAIRLNVGSSANLDDTEVSYDAGHALFADLPLAAFDWAVAGRLLDKESGRRPLISALRGGERLGDFVQLDENAQVLVFAGDPFSDAPIVDAALLLDNAIGVVSGERASQRARLTASGEVPSQRAAHAAPFEPRGEVNLRPRTAAPREYASWLMVAAACAALVATIAATRGKQKPGQIAPAV
ncbi:MAG: BatA domain-containing protein [Planctomycetes bacterium]|nr:BatA domain-containing protein [Planctomycetota bacterium]